MQSKIDIGIPSCSLVMASTAAALSRYTINILKVQDWLFSINKHTDLRTIYKFEVKNS